MNIRTPTCMGRFLQWLFLWQAPCRKLADGVQRLRFGLAPGGVPDALHQSDVHRRRAEAFGGLGMCSGAVRVRESLQHEHRNADMAERIRDIPAAEALSEPGGVPAIKG